MRVRINPHRFSGNIRVPASKSHTIRQLLIASLADGVSHIHYPLDSLDTRSCISACKTFGAEINEITETNNENGIVRLDIRGNGGFKKKAVLPGACIDVGNSGTTLYLSLAVAGLQSEGIKFTGDEQIQKRSAAPLLEALAGLGVKCESGGGLAGCVPVTIKGPWKGGRVSLPCPTSQYLSALLVSSPLAPADTVTEIDVPLLNEKPYIEMTLFYLKAQGIPFEATPDFSRFVIPGGSSWKPQACSVPADFSSAAFPAAAAAITGGPVTLTGLDPQDTQGDKFFLEMLKTMGCEVGWRDEEGGKTVTVSRDGPLRGGTFDLNETPDLLPAAAAVAAFAGGDTSLVNVAHARIKETDRIAVMAGELAKLGVKCTERPDGLVIHGKFPLFPSPSSLFPVIDGHGDHRIVMAFACAALGSPVPVEITGAESAAVTYPGFLQLLNAEKTG
jgi:3-phosphoshikimate 1-carboxyvinyltransferase